MSNGIPFFSVKINQNGHNPHQKSTWQAMADGAFKKLQLQPDKSLHLEVYKFTSCIKKKQALFHLYFLACKPSE